MPWPFSRYVCGLRGEYQVVSPREWQEGADRHFWLRDYEVLDPFEARAALADIRRTPEGTELLRNVAREVLPDYRSIAASSTDDARWSEAVERALGWSIGRQGAPPRLALFYICRRKRTPQAPQPPFDSWKSTLQAIEAAKAAARAYVTIEAITEDEEPLPHLPLEVLLADAEVINRSTDSNGRLHLEPIPRGRCTVRVTTVDGAAWSPSTGSSSRVDQQHRRVHVVRQGERLGSIARRYGFYDWKKLWNAPDNGALREKRREPQWIRAGDEIVIPAIQIHQVVWPTDQSHRIIVRERPDEASVFVVTPYTQVDVDRGVDAELTLSGTRYSQKLLVSANRIPVSDYFDVQFVELEFKGVPTNGRYALKIKPEGSEEHIVFEDVPFTELMDDAPEA
jgi:hypothetical protein